MSDQTSQTGPSTPTPGAPVPAVGPLKLPDGNTLTGALVATFPYGDLNKYHYLGYFHWYFLTSCKYARNTHTNGLHGLIQPHLDRYMQWCGGGITFAGHTHPGTSDSERKQADWDLLSLHPLHIEPSLLCRSHLWRSGHDEEECGDHGFIRDGKWVKA